jgi:hypothetical protein
MKLNKDLPKHRQKQNPHITVLLAFLGAKVSWLYAKSQG